MGSWVRILGEKQDFQQNFLWKLRHGAVRS